MNKSRFSKARPSRKSRTDWERLNTMRDAEIDDSDIPALAPEQFAKAMIRKGLKPLPAKQQITLRIDADVLAWFKRSGPGYQTQINRLLRAYVEAHEAKS